MSEELLRSKKGTAGTLGISVRTLENLVNLGEITPRRIGKRVLFDVREIQRFARHDHRTKQQRKEHVDDGQELRVQPEQ